jgi:hypothetical protein
MGISAGSIRRRKKVSTSFFEKKEAKKLLLLGRGCGTPRGQEQKFFDFFSKKNFFLWAVYQHK